MKKYFFHNQFTDTNVPFREYVKFKLLTDQKQYDPILEKIKAIILGH